MTTITVGPTPTGLTFEALVGRIQTEGGALPIQQQAILHMILMELQRHIDELRKVERERGSCSGLQRARRIDRLASLLRMAMPWTEDESILVSRLWAAVGVEVH